VCRRPSWGFIWGSEEGGDRPAKGEHTSDGWLRVYAEQPRRKEEFSAYMLHHVDLLTDPKKSNKQSCLLESLF